MTAPILATERLRLRPLVPEDADALFAAYSDPAVMHYWSSAPHDNVAQTRAMLGARIAEQSENVMLAVTWADDDRALGTVNIMPRKPAVIEIGYMFVRATWGKGVACEAVSRVIDHIFDDLGARRIFADTDPDNAGSIALLERLGFLREGLLRAEWETHIGVRDTALYGLLKPDWLNAR